MAYPGGNTTYFSARHDDFDAPALGIVAIADINDDGLLDLIGHEYGANEQDAQPLRFALGLSGGGFAPDVLLVTGQVPTFMQPQVLVGDFTGDGRTDLVVYDEGYYDWATRSTHGGEPMLLIGQPSGTFAASGAIRDAALPFVRPAPAGSVPNGIQIDLTMGIKDVDAADIDGDGDLDLWVESTGSRNISSHFLINDGGQFHIDINDRIDRSTLFGSGNGDFWRYGHATFLDVNSDGAPDLILGQIRDDHPTHLRQSSFVLLNDGRGHYPQSGAIRLPLPDFYLGYTSAQAMDAWDINRDGRQDLVLVHTRNDDVTGSVIETPWTGTYVQVLIQNADGTFRDETVARIGPQDVWSSVSLSQYFYANGIMHDDVNHDGITDFVLGYLSARPSASTPVVFFGRGDSRFEPADTTLITAGDPWFGEGARALDLNGDGLLDFVHVDKLPGPNGQYEAGPSDDYMAIVTQLGRLPLGGGGTPAAMSLHGGIDRDWMTGGNGDDVVRADAGNDWLAGAGGNDQLYGGEGTDTAVYTRNRADYQVVRDNDNLIVRASAGNEGRDTLNEIERLAFADQSLAFDLDGHAGTTARYLGAVFGRAAVTNKSYAGIGLSRLDDGVSTADLMQLALDARLGPGFSRASLVDTLHFNLVGTLPTAADQAFWVGTLASGQYTPVTLAQMAAALDLNAQNIDLLGLANGGLGFV